MEEMRMDNTICMNEVIFDGQAEQGIELDYVLPDYCPEIFKIMKCRIIPKILSYSMVGDTKIVYDGCADIKVLYLAENSPTIHCIEQHYTYSKTVDIGKKVNLTSGTPDIRLQTKPDYCNCRAVSGRRIDVRGAVSTKIHITMCNDFEIPSIPDGVQARIEKTNCCNRLLNTEKTFSIREEIETGASGISCILRSCCLPKVNDVRVIADKVIVKGIISINAAYGLNEDTNVQGCSTIERMNAEIPVSQIIDMSGIDDSFSCSAEVDIMSCELISSADSGIISCNIQAVCRITCHKENTVSFTTDVFSTEYATEHSTRTIKAIRQFIPVSKQSNIKSSIESEYGELEIVWDCSSDIYNLACTVSDEGKLILTGLICYQLLGKTTDGLPCLAEKQEGFECEISSEQLPKNHTLSFTATCIDTDYSLKTDGTVDLNAIIDFNGTICETQDIQTIEDVLIHEDKPKHKNNDFALRIYYADGTEDCWTVAKRYDASVDAIMRENDIQDRDLPLNGMVLIPSV